jgi:hypothetical protein
VLRRSSETGEVTKLLKEGGSATKAARVDEDVVVHKRPRRLGDGGTNDMAIANERHDIRTPSVAIRTLLEQVQAEYAEMPGLSVTLPQAQRLWVVDQATCEEVFSRLISRGVLRRTTKGRFVRA